MQRALDLGVTLVDTARAYGTEEIVGRALKGRRDDVVLSTKALLEVGNTLRDSLDRSLGLLQTDYVDVFFLHGVTAAQYARVGEDSIAELLALRDAGKLRYLAISERFGDDPGHEMLPDRPRRRRVGRRDGRLLAAQPVGSRARLRRSPPHRTSPSS